jgi:uncharacterized protein (TIGR02271 family)
MKATQRSTVIGVFTNREHAQQAVNELRRLGFREDQIGVAARDSEPMEGTTTVGDQGNKAATGAATGLAAGAGLGALWGIGIAAGLLPAIGPAIAGGTLATILSSAAAGAAAAGIAGALIGLGLPEDEANYYEGEFQAGRTLVTVKADGRYDQAYEVLRRHGAYDMSTRESPTHGAMAHSGTSKVAQGATAHGTSTHVHGAACGTTATTGAHAKGDRTVQVREEEMRVQKQPVQTGEVTVRKEVHTEHKTLDVPVRKEEVVVERRPASGKAATSGITEGETIRAPVMEEQVHVEKRPVVKEEVHVGKHVVQDTEHVSGTVKKEEVKVEKKGDADIKHSKRP